MPSFARRRPPTAAWSVDDASTFAAQKEFKLLQLLSTDKKEGPLDGASPRSLLKATATAQGDRKVWCSCGGDLGTPAA